MVYTHTVYQQASVHGAIICIPTGSGQSQSYKLATFVLDFVHMNDQSVPEDCTSMVLDPTTCSTYWSNGSKLN